jgi:hypothetical protein
MSIRSILRILVLFSIALVPAVSRAQQGGATVRGTVTDPDQAVIPGATVTLTPPKGAAHIVQSGADGAYVFRNTRSRSRWTASPRTCVREFMWWLASR